MLATGSESEVRQNRPSVKFVVNKKDLLTAISKAAALAPKTKSSNLYSYVFLTTKDNELEVVLSYPEAYLKTVVPVESGSTFPTTVAFKTQKLYSILTASDKQLSFDVTDEMVEIRSGVSLWKEPRTDIEPSKRTDVINEDAIEVDTFALLTGLNTVKYAMENDSVRPALYMVDCANGRLRACNGYRYHEINTGISNLSFSVGGNLVDGFTKLLRFFDGPIKFFNGKDSYQFENGDTVCILNKLQTTFPDLDKILIRPLKVQTPALLRVRKTSLIDAIKKVRLSVDEAYPYIELHLNPSEVLLRVTQKSGEEAITQIAGKWDATPRIVTFNARMLQETIEHTAAEELEVRFGADTKMKKSPLVIEGVGTWTMLNQVNLTKR